MPAAPSNVSRTVANALSNNSRSRRSEDEIRANDRPLPKRTSLVPRMHHCAEYRMHQGNSSYPVDVPVGRFFIGLDLRGFRSGPLRFFDDFPGLGQFQFQPEIFLGD